jgi:prepilin-type N-terminal cleavage/methylation domain-containing protein
MHAARRHSQGLVRRPHAGFTIVELIVVMAIVATLIAIIAPALSGARKRASKTTELNNLKHVGHAWMLYANHNADAALPGFLEVRVQRPTVPGVSRGWGVTYKYPDNSFIPLTSANITGPWTWRLLSYLDYNHSTIHAHLEEARPDIVNLVSEAPIVAYEPAFGYNGYYVGGYWSMLTIDGVETPRIQFFDHCTAGATPGRAVRIPTGVGQIARPSEMITFCSSTRYPSTGVQKPLPSNTPGWHLVSAPTIGTEARWRPAAGDPARLVEVAAPGALAPLMRHTNTVALLRADGHVDEQGYNALFDPRQWIDSADAPGFAHAPCASSP